MERIERLTVTGLADLARVRAHIRALLGGCDTDEVVDCMLVADELCGLVCQSGNLPARVSLIRSFGRPGLSLAVTAPPAAPVLPVWSRVGARVLESCATDWGIGHEGNRMKLWACVRLRSPADLPAPRAPMR